jgi:hypothetical protein
MSPALYVSVSLATCGGLCRFGEAWAALIKGGKCTYWAAPCASRRPLRSSVAEALADGARKRPKLVALTAPSRELRARGDSMCGALKRARHVIA